MRVLFIDPYSDHDAPAHVFLIHTIHTESHPTPRRSLTPHRLALLLTVLFHPVLVSGALILAVALDQTSSPAAGLGWGTLALVFTALLPTLDILRGVEQHRLLSLTVPLRRHRPSVFLSAALSALLGLAVLALLHAPRDLLALLGTIIIGLLGVTIISLVWKISVHTSTLAAAIAILALLYGPPALILAPLVPLVAWARVTLHAHTPAEVSAGAILGAVAGPLVFSLLR